METTAFDEPSLFQATDDLQCSDTPFATAFGSLDEDIGKIHCCPKSHDLEEYTLDDSTNLKCAECDAIACTFYGCLSCKYPICINCAAKQVVLRCKTFQKRCKRRHGLVLSLTKRTTFCGSCSRLLLPQRKVLGCETCKYHLCLKCAFGSEPTHYDILNVLPNVSNEQLQDTARLLWKDFLISRQASTLDDETHQRVIYRVQRQAVAFKTLSNPHSRITYEEVLRISSSMVGQCDKLAWEMYSPLFSPPNVSGVRRPSVRHAAYVGVVGTMAAPVYALGTGAILCADGIIYGSREIAKGIARSADGIRPRKNNGEESDKDTTKHSRNVSKIVTEPATGLVTGIGVAGKGVVGGVVTAIGGTFYGMTFNCRAARRELQAMRHERSSKNQPIRDAPQSPTAIPSTPKPLVELPVNSSPSPLTMT